MAIVLYKLLHGLRLRVSPTRQQVYSEIPDWVVGDSGDQVRRRALLVFIILFVFIFNSNLVLSFILF